MGKSLVTIVMGILDWNGKSCGLTAVIKIQSGHIRVTSGGSLNKYTPHSLENASIIIDSGSIEKPFEITGCPS